MSLFLINAVRFNATEDVNRERCIIDHTIVKTLRAGLYENAEDFLTLFRGIESIELVHCDTEVEVIMPMGNRQTLLNKLVYEIDRAKAYTVEDCFLNAA